MQRLTQILYAALTSDTDIMKACGYVAPTESSPGQAARIKSTCFEVPPDKDDKTPLPYILILDEGIQPSQTTKDDGWMPGLWLVGAGVEVAAKSPNDVDELLYKAMKAIADYISSLDSQGEDIPRLSEGFPQTQGVGWDWTKPCYFDIAHYQCDVENINDDEQDE